MGPLQFPAAQWNNSDRVTAIKCDYVLRIIDIIIPYQVVYSQLVFHVWLYQKHIKRSIYGNCFTFAEWFWLLERRNNLRWNAFFPTCPPHACRSQQSVLTWKYAYAQFCKNIYTDNIARYIQPFQIFTHCLLSKLAKKIKIRIKKEPTPIFD